MLKVSSKIFRVSVVVLSFLSSGSCGFFDLTDVDDPLALLWNSKHENTIKQSFNKVTQCQVDSSKGVCMTKARCLLTGGTPTGTCGLFTHCCIYEKSCVQTTDQKVKIFESGELNPAVSHCKYTVKLRNKNICQVRVDFEKLILAPVSHVESTTESSIKCVNDSLRIAPNHFGIPMLCGKNSGQHVYVHVNQSDGSVSAVNLDFNLASREHNSLVAPTWKIKITQLECPARKEVFDVSKYTDNDGVADDFVMLAPLGAIQYFTEKTGVIKSFGYDDNLADTVPQSYPYGEYYAIAFRRPSYSCGIQFDTKFLNLAKDGTSASTCTHYLFVPDAYTTSATVTLEDSKICENAVTPFYDLTPGPLFIFFKALDFNSADLTAKYGFVLNYQLLTYNSCPIID